MNLITELIYISSISLMLVVALIVSFKRSGYNIHGRRFLAIYFWAFFYAALLSYLVLSRDIIYVPHLFRTAFLTWCLVMPCSYMYLLQTLYPRKLKVSDLLHLLPFFLYLVDYIPFFTLSAPEKMKLLESLSAEELRTGFNEGWFMPKFGYHLIRLFQISFYSIAQVLLLIKVNRSSDHPLPIENPVKFKWLKFFIGSQLFMLFGPLIAGIFIKGAESGVYSNSAALIVSLLQCYFLVFHPQVMYGFFLDSGRSSPLDNRSEQEPIMVYSLEHETIEPEEAGESKLLNGFDEVGEAIENFVITRQPFLQPGYKLTDMAHDTGIGIHKISAYINSVHKMNFYNFLNKHRIDLYLNKISTSEIQEKTLEGLAMDCGFNSRSTFLRAFKSITGFTPTQYLEQNKPVE